MLMSREKSGQRAPPSLTLNRLLQFARQAQTVQLCRDMGYLGLLFILGELIDDFVAADQSEVLAGNAFQITAV